jgi:DNA repair protein RecO (recombination protein O)
VKGARAARVPTRTRALLLRRVEHGESDLVVQFFTERLGRISALARGARRSQKRFGGALEPFHTLSIEVDDPGAGDLHHLREATLERPRMQLASDLDRLDAAGRAMAWVRGAALPRQPEPPVWEAITTLLDRLDEVDRAEKPRLVLAEQGLALLAAFGWGLDFERCVRCGKPCVPGKAAMIDAARGGLVCRACGGATTRLSGALRARLAAGTLEVADVDTALDLVEKMLKAHAGMG